MPVETVEAESVEPTEVTELEPDPGDVSEATTTQESEAAAPGVREGHLAYSSESLVTP